MMWLVWRQQRFELLLGLGVFGIVAALLLVTGVTMINTYNHLSVGSCLTSSSLGCSTIRDAFQNQFSPLIGVVSWFNFLPLIFGFMLSAPLVSEMESGTYRLAWTQSITRKRWLTMRLLFVMGGAVVVSIVFMLLMRWWRGPMDHLVSPFDNAAFDFEGPVVIAYGIFATSLVLAAGTVLRRTVPAIGIGLVAFLAVRLFIEDSVRAHFMTPVTVSPSPRGWGRTLGWVLDGGWKTTSGSSIDLHSVLSTCGALQSKSMSLSCIQRHGFVDYMVYQPANRYWTFQGIETGIFLTLSAVLVLIAAGWIRVRLR